MTNEPPYMTWQEDPNFWIALDGFAHLSWIPLKELLDVLYEHRLEIAEQGNAMLFGGIGRFMQTYTTARRDGATEIEAFNAGVQAVQTDPRVKRLIEQSANQLVDGQVDRMKGAF
jgi:hypothetical protein